MTTSVEYLDEAEMPLSDFPQSDCGHPPASPPLHGCEWPRAARPPATVRDWQDAQPEKMLDRYKVAPIHFAR